MSKLIIHGTVPLAGDISLSGSPISAIKLIYAAMFSNEDIVLNNVPHTGYLDDDLEILTQLGALAEWVGDNKLRLNGSGINTHIVPKNPGAKTRAALLLGGPLVFRFGKAVLPKPTNRIVSNRPINRFLEAWESLGYDVQTDDEYIYLYGDSLKAATYNFKIRSHMATANAVLSALFISGETIIKNASSDVELEDLTAFCNLLGGDVQITEDNTIKITGSNVFKKVSFDLQSFKDEAVLYTIAALITGGNVTISHVNRTHILSFLNVLSKIGCMYEFSNDKLKVWHAGEQFLPTSITSAPNPGFLTEWVPLITVLLSQAHGESLVHDSIYTDRFGYVPALKDMGFDMEILKPSEVGLDYIVSDDSYDIKSMGEPSTVARVKGPTQKVFGSRFDFKDLRYASVYLLAGLFAQSQSEIINFDKLEKLYEGLFSKLLDLGANLELVDE